MKWIKPLVAALLFFWLSIFFTYYFVPTLAYLHLNTTSEFSYFISSPFNMTTEGAPIWNLYLPTILIFVLGMYLKNFNAAFQKKCNLRSIFVMSIIASYVKSIGSLIYYKGYADYGISLGTSIITLSFIAAFVISLEVYIEEKETVEHLYGRFMFALLSILLLMLTGLTLLSFFATSSFIVHLMGLTAFLLMFIPFYERHNIMKFLRKEELALVRLEKELT